MNTKGGKHEPPSSSEWSVYELGWDFEKVEEQQHVKEGAMDG